MLQRFARFLLWISGWEAIGECPEEAKAVLIAAPHTSNWDGFWALTYKVAVGLDVHFFAKHSLFWFPLGTVLRALGGIPLNRSRAESSVAQAVTMFKAEDQFYFALAPEGTRALKPAWKTGFHRIASAAEVPVYFGVLDYGQRRIGIAGRYELTGDMDADLDRCAEFYRDIEGRWPEKASPVRPVDRNRANDGRA